MNEQDISQKTLSSLTVLFKDRFDILLDFLAKRYPITFNKIIEQSVTLQTKKPTPLLQQFQSSFQKRGMLGLIGTVANKLFKNVDPTKQANKNLTELFQNQDEQEKTSYEDGNVKLKSDSVLSTSVAEPLITTQDENKQSKPLDYFKDTIEPIPFKFDGFTEDGETALWNVFPPLFKDIFKDILRGIPTPEETTTASGPRSSFQEKGLVGTLMDWFDFGEDFFPGRGDSRGRKSPRTGPKKDGIFKKAGRLLGRGVTSIGSGVAGLGRGALEVGRGALALGKTPVSTAALGKAGALGVAGTAGAVVGGEVIGGQIGKMLVTNDTISEYLYGDKDAGKEAVEKYGTGILGGLRAGYDVLFGEGATQRQEARESKAREVKMQKEAIEKNKTLDEPTKRKKAIVLQKTIDESLQTIENIKKDATTTKEDKESRIRQIYTNVLLYKQQLESLKPQSTPSIKPPKSSQSQPQITVQPVQSQTTVPPVQSQTTVPSVQPVQPKKVPFKDLQSSNRSTELTIKPVQADNTQQPNLSKEIKTDIIQQKIEQPYKEINPIPATPILQVNKEKLPAFPISNKPISLSLHNNETLKEFQDTQYKHSLNVNNISTPTQTNLIPLNNEQSLKQPSSIGPDFNNKSNITPIQIETFENLKDIKLPDNTDVLSNIASNTETTNSTLKNLNGAILKLAQVFNDKLDKTGSKNNLFINGQPQQDSRPSASQVAASNVDPIGIVRRQFGLV